MIIDFSAVAGHGRSAAVKLPGRQAGVAVLVEGERSFGVFQLSGDLGDAAGDARLKILNGRVKLGTGDHVSCSGVQAFAHLIHLADQTFGLELVGEDILQPFQVAATACRRGEKRLGYQSVPMRRDGRGGGLTYSQDLIKAMRHKDKLVLRIVMKEPIVVWTKAITIPMLEQHFEGGKGKEAVHIQELFEPREALGGIGQARGCKQRGEVRAIGGIVAGIHFEGLADVAT